MSRLSPGVKKGISHKCGKKNNMDSFSNMNQKDQEKVVSKFINNAKKDQGNEIKLTTGGRPKK